MFKAFYIFPRGCPYTSIGALLPACVPRESLEGGSGAGKGRAGSDDCVFVALVPLSRVPTLHPAMVQLALGRFRTEGCSVAHP